MRHQCSSNTSIAPRELGQAYIEASSSDKPSQEQPEQHNDSAIQSQARDTVRYRSAHSLDTVQRIVSFSEPWVSQACRSMSLEYGADDTTWPFAMAAGLPMSLDYLA